MTSGAKNVGSRRHAAMANTPNVRGSLRPEEFEMHDEASFEVDHAGVLSSGDGGLDFHKLDEWTEVKRPREVGVHWWKRGKKQCLVASGKCRLCFDSFHRDDKAPSKSLTLRVGSTTASDCVSDRLYLAARQGCRSTLCFSEPKRGDVVSTSSDSRPVGTGTAPLSALSLWPCLRQAAPCRTSA
jgi:hypothetical protein